MKRSEKNCLSVKGLTKKYRSRYACKDISFSIGEGECVGLLGPNGAGKTTLLSCLVGLKFPSTGVVEFDSSLLSQLSSKGSLVSYVFDPPSLSADFTGEDAIVWEALAKGLPHSAARDTVQRYGVSDFAKTRVRKMSTGQRRRIAIAASLVGEPELLILDEPTNGLDIESSIWLRNIINERTEQGMTTIVSSHRLGEVRQVVSRVLIVQQTLKFDGLLPDADDDALERWYLDKVGNQNV